MTSFWAVFTGLLLKEIKQATRNPAMLRVLIINQALLFAMVGWLDVIVRDLPAVIVDEDRTVESRELISRIEALRTVDLKYATSSVEQAREDLRTGRAR